MIIHDPYRSGQDQGFRLMICYGVLCHVHGSYIVRWWGLLLCCGGVRAIVSLRAAWIIGVERGEHWDIVLCRLHRSCVRLGVLCAGWLAGTGCVVFLVGKWGSWNSM
ncbi:hypothetical protein BO99DRAFT_143052 [Aspergillus violaceofuscus CBS 115571]|uniref:Uncharacterized protein n=1 Tax=Aspergillus violaceofuscus (strain CBS 115571) TaxID=1450538 RepID=A0A2V5HSD3_ASPV1|nr:hypothetical protein BO99DRAFT_143052 [Aspergillus violaceofuscus CBS 115571]